MQLRTTVTIHDLYSPIGLTIDFFETQEPNRIKSEECPHVCSTFEQGILRSPLFP